MRISHTSRFAGLFVAAMMVSCGPHPAGPTAENKDVPKKAVQNFVNMQGKKYNEARKRSGMAKLQDRYAGLMVTSKVKCGTSPKARAVLENLFYYPPLSVEALSNANNTQDNWKDLHRTSDMDNAAFILGMAAGVAICVLPDGAVSQPRSVSGENIWLITSKTTTGQIIDDLLRPTEEVQSALLKKPAP